MKKINTALWSSRYKGLITIPIGSAGACCSLYEGEYDSPEQAAKQIASAKTYARKRYEEYGIPLL